MPDFAVSFRTALIACALLTFTLSGARAQDDAGEGAPGNGPDPREIFATQGDVILTQRELDAVLSAIPEDQRAAFVRDGARMDQLVASLLKRKLIAADARKVGFDQQPLVADRVHLAGQKELAEAWIAELTQQAPAADYEALAREDYLVNPDRYRGPAVLDVSHILIGAEGRGFPEAESLAQMLSAWLEQSPQRWDELVEKYSDDPSKGENGGRFQGVVRGQMVAPFEQAAFSMKEPGSISKPVRTEFGYHLIRLNGRTGEEVLPYEDVREKAIEQVRAVHLARYRERYLRSLGEGKIEVTEGAVEELVRRYLGDDADGLVVPRD